MISASFRIAASLSLLGGLAVAQAPDIFDTWRGYDTGTYVTGRSPKSVATGDIDGDGDVDAVVANSDSFARNFAVFKNQGDGGYGPRKVYSIPKSSTDAELGDLDGDGDLDLLLCDTGQYGEGTTVGVQLNDGTGNFGARTAFGVGGAGPSDAQLADFDHDGDLDVAVALYGLFGAGTSASLLRNDGSGQFGAPTSIAIQAGVHELVAADLNADGWTDLAVALDAYGSQQTRIAVSQNDRAGHLLPPVIYDASPTINWAGNTDSCIAAGDMDDDGDVDLVFSSLRTWDGNQGGFQMFSNDGSGAFGPKQYVDFGVPFTAGAIAIEIADLDQNGWLDIAAEYFSDVGWGGFTVLLRSASGGYPAATLHPAGTGVTDLALVDVDADGTRDLLATNYYSYELTVHLNPGNGVFPRPPVYETEPLHYNLDTGDIDGDGDLDVATAGGYGTAGSVSILLNLGSGQLGTWTDYAAPYYAGGVKLRDLDGDGDLDLLWGDFNAPNGVPLHARWRENDATGNFGGTQTISMSMADINEVDALDLDADGDLDVVASDSLRGELKIALNQGGSFAPGFGQPATLGLTLFTNGDFNGDGRVDLAGTAPEPYGYSHQVAVLFGTGQGTFGAPLVLNVDDGPHSIAAGDFDGDGDLDIVTANTGFENDREPSLSLLKNNGNGSFAAEIRLKNSALSTPRRTIAADVDGDQDLDLLVLQQGSNDVGFIANDGLGNFAQQVHFGVSHSPLEMRFVDITGDGVRDVVAICELPPQFRSAVAIVSGVEQETSVGTTFCFGSASTCPCGNDGGASAGCANSSGTGALARAFGSASVSLDNLVFSVSQLPNGKPTLLFQGSLSTGGAPLGDGLKCVAGSIRRLGVVASSADGSASFGPGLASRGQWAAGQTRNFQVWYRDPNGPCSSGHNLSSAVAVTFVP